MRACFRPAVVAAIFLTVTLAGCAPRPNPSDADAVAEYRDADDPLEPTNRVFYSINNGIDTVALRPLAIAYRDAVPTVIRTHTHNILVNLGMPVALFDDILSAKPRRAGDSLMRLVINTSVGVGGIFDVATGWGYPNHDTDAGLAFALWGMPDGVFLFLPILGPTNPRDVAGFGTDIVMDPSTWVGQGPVLSGLAYGRVFFGAIDARERVLDDLDRIKAQALDPYATFRSLARQHRRSQIEDVRGDDRRTVPAWFSQPTPAQ
jgi:phospholipid-binding lipoprotein MlaA